MLSVDTREKLQGKLLGWFRQVRRDLPWRRTNDPYRIWVSEIMLQQTRVAAVIPYYERFLRRFPDVRTLAEAPQDEVLRLWSGLGYYSRARNLQNAAQQIVAKHDGKFPRALGEVLELPGIGAYTAAAILSIAYGEELAVLDGNVARVLARFHAIRGDLRDAKRWAALQRSADELLAMKAPGEWNQAMMELGATLCTPRSPQCLLCPIAEFCEARKKGLAESLPEKRVKRKTVDVKLATAVLFDSSGRTLLLPPSGANGRSQAADHVPTLASQMWHFPTVSFKGNASAELRKFLDDLFSGKSMPLTKWEHAGCVRHAVTFRNIAVEVFRIAVKKLPEAQESRIIALGNVDELPVSNLTRKIARVATEAKKSLIARLSMPEEAETQGYSFVRIERG